MKTIKIGGKRLRLEFTVDTMEALEKLRGGDPLNIDELSKSLKDAKFLSEVLLLMAQTGADMTGETLDIDAAWIKRRMLPGQHVKLVLLVYAVITEAMEADIDVEDESGDIDVVLEELKKKGAEASDTGR